MKITPYLIRISFPIQNWANEYSYVNKENLEWIEEYLNVLSGNVIFTWIIPFPIYVHLIKLTYACTLIYVHLIKLTYACTLIVDVEMKV